MDVNQVNCKHLYGNKNNCDQPTPINKNNQLKANITIQTEAEAGFEKQKLKLKIRLRLN